MSDSIGPASVRSDAYYLLAELFERAELEELLDAQTGVLLGIALSDLLREGWTILAPPPKADVPKADFPRPYLEIEVERDVADAILHHREERRWMRARAEAKARAEAEADVPKSDLSGPEIITGPEYADVATELRRVFAPSRGVGIGRKYT